MQVVYEDNIYFHLMNFYIKIIQKQYAAEKKLLPISYEIVIELLIQMKISR